MQIQRYLFTALLAVLIWPVYLWFTGDWLFSIMREYPEVALLLLGSIFLGTLAAIWCVDGATAWSSGGLPLISVKSTAM